MVGRLIGFFRRNKSTVRLWGNPFDDGKTDRWIVANPGQGLLLVPMKACGDALLYDGSQLAIYSEIFEGIYIYRGLLEKGQIEWAYKDLARRREERQLRARKGR